MCALKHGVYWFRDNYPALGGAVSQQEAQDVVWQYELMSKTYIKMSSF
jgi:hypothetical protein